MAAYGFCLLVLLALHAVLGVPVIWIEGEDGWEKAGIVIMWTLVAAGLLGTWLFIPDASVVVRIVVIVVWRCDWRDFWLVPRNLLGVIMSSQRVSRGFHRLGMFLAAIPLLVGGTWAIISALNVVSEQRSHDEQIALVCAKKQLAAKATPSDQPAEKSQGPWTFEEFTQPITHDLKSLGCSDVSRNVSEREILDARAPAEFHYASALLLPLAVCLAITLAISLAVYGLARAIGWVIGGFAASGGSGLDGDFGARTATRSSFNEIA